MHLYNTVIEAIRRSPHTDVERRTQEENTPAPPHPILDCPQTAFTPAIESSIQKQRENIRRYDAAADHAIQIIKPFLSSRLLNSSTPMLNDPTKGSRVKLLCLWSWLKAKRINDAQIISNIKKDMSRLPEIQSFEDAL